MMPSDLPNQTPSPVASLQPLTAALLECVTVADVVAAVIDRAITTLGAHAGLVALITSDGKELEIAGTRGYAPTTLDGWQRLPLTEPLPLSDVVRDNTTLYFENRQIWSERYPAVAPHLEAASQASVSLPLSARQRVFGALHFTFSKPQIFPVNQRALLEELARQTSLALERALLLEEVETAHRRQEFLARASAILGDSLDYQSRFEEFARLCVPELADWAAIDIISETDSVERVATAHRTPAGEETMREILRRFPPESQRNRSIRTVIEEGKTFLVPEINDEMLALSGMLPDHVALLKSIGFRSLLCLPLHARGKNLGALSIGFGEETAAKRTFTPDVVRFAEELTQRAAIAVDNARLFDASNTAQQRAEMVLESIGEEFYALDAKENFTYVNRRALDVWQMRREDVIGRNIWEVFPFAAQGPVYEAQVQTMRDRRAVGFEGISPLRRTWVEGTVHPADDGGISVYLRDAEQRRQAEQAQSTATEALRRSEERYRRLLDTAMEGILFLDAEAKITRVNLRMARMLGYDSPDDLVGQEVYYLFFSEDEWRARDRWAARLQGKQEEYELRLRRKDHTECLVIAHVSIERDALTGATLGTFTMFTDITERQRALDAVRAKSDEVSSILESITDAFFTVDDDWCFTYLNNEAERVLFRTREELLGKNLWEEFPAAVGAKFDIEYHRAMQEQVAVSFEAYYPVPIDTWFEVHAYPSPNALSVYFRNVNAERRAQQERENLLTEQQRLVAELQEASIRQRRFLREMLFGFSDGRLRLCDTPSDLPAPLTFSGVPVFLVATSLHTLRRHVAVAANAVQMLPERLQDLLTAVGEASMNAVRHGGGGTAEVHTDKEKGIVQIWIQDRGAGIAEELIHRAIERGWTTGGFGHGFFLMLKTGDRIWLLTGAGGTTVVIEQDREEANPLWLQAVE